MAAPALNLPDAPDADENLDLCAPFRNDRGKFRVGRMKLQVTFQGLQYLAARLIAVPHVDHQVTRLRRDGPVYDQDVPFWFSIPKP